MWSVTGTAWKGGDDLVGQTSGAIANIDANGIAFGYDWFTAQEMLEHLLMQEI